MKTAIIIGATGLVGSKLLKILLNDDRFGKVKVFTRRSTNIISSKLDEKIIDFDDEQSYKHLVKGDYLFCCMGTTLKDAGSKENQYKIDYTYQYNFAKIARENTVSDFAIVSAAMTNPNSKFFYPRMKGELERDIQQLNFRRIRIIKPSLLIGERENPRLGEKISEILLNLLTKFTKFKYLKAIKAEIVAKAMLNSIFDDEGKKVKSYEYLEVFDLAKESY